MTDAQPMNQSGKAFAVVAMIEAVTWTGLLLGMFLKYVTETTDLGVWLFGRLHGLAHLGVRGGFGIPARVRRHAEGVERLQRLPLVDRQTHSASRHSPISRAQACSTMSSTRSKPASPP